MYRAELSGVLGGLTRVRAMQLNDAHVFCTPDQVAGEARDALKMIRQAYAALGIVPRGTGCRCRAPAGSTWPAADLGTGSRRAGRDPQRRRLELRAGEGRAAFYGPKIDVQVADSSDREATLSTVQVDLYQPQQFDLSTSGWTGTGTARSWCTAASSAAWNGRSRTLSSGTAGRSPPGLLRCSSPCSGRWRTGASRARGRPAGGRARAARPYRRAGLGHPGQPGSAARLVPYQAVIGEGRPPPPDRPSGSGTAAAPATRSGALTRIAAHAAARRTELWDAAAPASSS